MTDAKSYFERVGEARFRASEHVGGGWNPDEQHIAPAMGLLAHVVESDLNSRRDDGLLLSRVSYDILGTLPIDVVDVEVEVLRPGRTIELVEARLGHAGRVALILRAWLMRAYDTATITGTSLPAIKGPDSLSPWDPTSTWPGGLIRSIEARREEIEPGRATSWIRTDVTLIDGESVSPTARALGLLDIANGVAPRAPADLVRYPNLDLTAHLFRQPRGDWLGLDTTVTFGRDGIGLTHSIVHDEQGPIGTVMQCLTVRPR